MHKRSQCWDQLHPKLLNWLAIQLTEPVTALFNNFLATAVVLVDWKAPVICPIPKKVGPKDAANYHPVSITSVNLKKANFNISEPG